MTFEKFIKLINILNNDGEINKGKKWNDVTLFSTLKEAKQYIDDHYTVAELLQYASSNTKVHIYTKITNNEFEGTVDELKSKHAGFLYDTIMIWSNLNHNNVVEIYCY